LVKQVPRVDELVLGPDGRLVRDGLDLELNPYCRRAVTKGIELAAALGTQCVVITLGPPSAEDTLREAIACGADRGVLLSDLAFQGSDSYATANALVAAIRAVGGSDLVLVGRNSVDADTGQVGPAVAESLGYGFLSGVKSMTLGQGIVAAGCQQDDRWVELTAELPLVIACAERLCEPAKAPPEARAAVDADRVSRLTAADLGPGAWGAAGSLTDVGEAKAVRQERSTVQLSGDVGRQVEQLLDYLVGRAVLPARRMTKTAGDVVPASSRRSGTRILAVLDPERQRLQRELLGVAAELAVRLEAVVTAAVCGEVDPVLLESWGADEILVVAKPQRASCDQVAAVLADWAAQQEPWAVLASGTTIGREIGARMAMRLDAGMIGDAIELEVSADGRLLAWKPAFGGRMLAAVTARSAVQVATMRPGTAGLHAPRAVAGAVPLTEVGAVSDGLVHVKSSAAVDEVDALLGAATVVGVGQGVAPSDYPQILELCATLGAQLAATRKVTDKGWSAHCRQVGITGLSLSPDLYLAIGVSGKQNHMLGVQNARVLAAINPDPEAPIHELAEASIVAPWQEVVPMLIGRIRQRGLAAEAAETCRSAGIRGKYK
jgi:electron transfer flavoprotein alpha subunit